MKRENNTGCISANRPRIEALLEEYNLRDSHDRSGMRLGSMACVALPTCGLALAESERSLPDVVTEIEGILGELGLDNDPFTIRMTGCPNGCGRPYIAEIAFVGRAPGKYNVYLGGGFSGDRLNKLYKQSVPVGEITDLLRPIIARYAAERETDERFGDFVVRVGIISQTVAGNAFHDDIDNPQPGTPFSQQTLGGDSPRTPNQERYDAAFKRDAVLKAKESGRPVSHVAKEIGVAPSTLRGWIIRHKD